MTATTTIPRLLVNPVLGLSAHVVTTAADSGGALLAAETEVQPGGNGGPIHQHRRQEERFLLHEGTLRYRVGRRRGVLRAGETLVVPPGTAHAFRNDGAHVARMRAEFRPALRLEEFFARLFDLAARGEVDARGVPRPAAAARLMREFPDEFFYLPVIPVPVQRAIGAVLAPFTA